MSLEHLACQRVRTVKKMIKARYKNIEGIFRGQLWDNVRIKYFNAVMNYKPFQIVIYQSIFMIG